MGGAPSGGHIITMAFFAAGPARARTISRLSEPRGSLRTSDSSFSQGGRRSSLMTESLTQASDDLGPTPAQLQRSGVLNAGANICAEVMGAGLLSLPHACATLGWVLGLGTVGCLGALSAYSGVALTRAKRGLVVVGDAVTLSNSHHWSALIASCKKRGCVVDLRASDDV